MNFEILELNKIAVTKHIPLKGRGTQKKGRFRVYTCFFCGEVLFFPGTTQIKSTYIQKEFQHLNLKSKIASGKTTWQQKKTSH